MLRGQYVPVALAQPVVEPCRRHRALSRRRADPVQAFEHIPCGVQAGKQTLGGDGKGQAALRVEDRAFPGDRGAVAIQRPGKEYRSDEARLRPRATRSSSPAWPRCGRPAPRRLPRRSPKVHLAPRQSASPATSGSASHGEKTGEETWPRRRRADPSQHRDALVAMFETVANRAVAQDPAGHGPHVVACGASRDGSRRPSRG